MSDAEISFYPRRAERAAPMNEHVKHAIDFLSLATVVAALTAWLPPLAALASLIWTSIRIYETRTVQGWIHSWKKR
jgi:hypothetical protein